MKSECEIRVMLANEEAELENLKREYTDSQFDIFAEKIIRDARIKLMWEIVETKDNSCY